MVFDYLRQIPTFTAGKCGWLSKLQVFLQRWRADAAHLGCHVVEYEGCYVYTHFSLVRKQARHDGIVFFLSSFSFFKDKNCAVSGNTSIH